MLEAQMAWGWQPALYLFFGGLGAGTFIVAAILFYRAKTEYKNVISIAVWLSVLCLVVGLLLLVLELTQPLRALLLWQSFSNFGSWMALGAWIIFLAVIVFGLVAILMTDRLLSVLGKAIKPLPGLRDPLCNVLFGVGSVFGLGVAVYTGLLLMSAPGIPFWNSWLLPCLFTVSALDTGIAAVEIIIIIRKKTARNSGQMGILDHPDDLNQTTNTDQTANPGKASTPNQASETGHKTRKALEVAVISLVIIECVVLFVYLETMFAGGNYGSAVNTYAEEIAAYTSAFSLENGKFAPLFWGLVVACGLALPLVAGIVSLFVKGKMGVLVVLLGAAGALLGGCVLRFLILYAGVHADFIFNAAYWLTS